MSEHPPFQTLAPPPPGKPSRVVPIAMTIGCGVLLALGSCFGFVATLQVNEGHNKLLNTLSGWGMLVGVVLFVGGSIWAILAIIVHVIRAIRGNS